MTDTTNNCPQCEQMARRIEELEKALNIIKRRASTIDCDDCEETGSFALEAEHHARTALTSSPPSGMRVVSMEWLKEDHANHG